jgi:hypothetical protein
MFMKRQFSFLWAAFAILVALPGCGPYIPTNPTAGSAQVKVECRGAPVIRQMVLELLRSGRGKDISVGADGSFLEITAAFSPADTPPGKLAQILQDLNDLNGVLHVEVAENLHPIRQNF